MQQKIDLSTSEDQKPTGGKREVPSNINSRANGQVFPRCASSFVRCVNLDDGFAHHEFNI